MLPNFFVKMYAYIGVTHVKFPKDFYALNEVYGLMSNS